MYPLLREGKDRVIISKIQAPLQVNDVILFRYQGVYVLHRIIAIHGDTYITKGDHCKEQEVIPRTAIIGKMSGFYRKQKKINLHHWWYRWYCLWLTKFR